MSIFLGGVGVAPGCCQSRVVAYVICVVGVFDVAGVLGVAEVHEQVAIVYPSDKSC